MSTPTEPQPEDVSIWSRLLSVRREERAQVVFAVGAFFCVLFAIFLLRPLRDEMGLLGGASNLRYLYTATLTGTLVASIAFAHVSSRLPRRKFMAGTYRAVALVWVGFIPLIAGTEGETAVFVARAFFMVHAVSNVFVVSIFWALLADALDVAQSRRLFGLIAVGGTLGAIAGTSITGSVAGWVKDLEAGPDPESGRWVLLSLVLMAALMLEASVQLAAAFARSSQRRSAHPTVEAAALGGDFLEGLKLVFQRPYLQGIALFTFVYGVVQTIFTLQQNFILEDAITERAARTEFFAWTESAAQALTLIVQLFVTGRLMRTLGVGGALLVLPIVGVLGFAAISSLHGLGFGALSVVTVSIVAWRGLSHAAMRPAREALFVPTERAEKFKAKSFTDTFAFRGGDLASAWIQGTASLSTVTLLGLPLAAGWGALGVWLARRQAKLIAERADDERPAD